jgi:predicted RNA polymerase sigma factor
MTDRLRSDQARARRELASFTATPESALVVAPIEELDGTDVDGADETLTLLYLCCHPALTPASQLALTLRAVGGLTTAEIAQAFFVPEASMAQRISRAKQTIRTAGATFEMPAPDERAGRLAVVLHVLYLIFNEGYAASSGNALVRADLTAEAIRLTRSIRRQLPDDDEVAGLLALMLLTEARRPAREGIGGTLLPLAEQDRSTWNQAQIREGVALVSAALPRGSIGPYQLQAAIAAVHDEAPSDDLTDWAEVLALYDLLERVAPNPMVRLNRAVAVAMVHGAPAGLELLATLESDARLDGHHRLHAVRGHLLEMTGDLDAARESYLAAAAITKSVPEQRYLEARAARLVV